MRQRQHRRGSAHVLLHDQHGALGLEIEPAGVEANALADERNLGIAGFAPAQFDQPRGARRVRRAADRVNERKVLLQQIVAHDRMEFRAVLFGQSASRRLKVRRAHVIGRRVDQIARQRHAFDDAAQIVAVGAFGQHESHRLVLRLAIAREAIGAEREGQRGKPRIVRRIGKAVAAGRQHAGQQARQERVVIFFLAFQSEQHAAGRQDQVARCLGLEARGFHVSAVAFAKLGDDLGEG